MNKQIRKMLLMILLVWLCILHVDINVSASDSNGKIVNTRHQKYTYTEMLNDINKISEKYPDYIHVSIIGKTVDNRNIHDIVLGNPEAPKCVMFQASAHAREYMCSQLVMRQIEYYLENYNKRYKGESYHDIFDKVCVHIVPMTNPDGVTLAQKGVNGLRSKSLRKKLKRMRGIGNPSNWKANARGVDINRQFDYKFPRGRSLNKYACYAGYGGPRPASERESKALLYVVNTYKPKATVSYHAMGNVVFHGYKCDKTTSKKMQRLTAKIKSITGYSYLYTEPGPGFANYINYKKHIPSTTVEIGMYTTPVPSSQFPTVWKQNKNVIAAVAQMYE
ncbi:MAG: hypothetical protein IJ232_04320 [Lachnospiraceae bacterium]|nr:hypothetical protein [Lachnospiraceae bacterium]